MINSNCGCHQSGTTPDMSSKSATLRNMVNVSTSCSSVFIKPFDPNNSYLIEKLTKKNPSCGGDRMPDGGPPYFSSSQIDQIKRWICQGAKNN